MSMKNNAELKKCANPACPVGTISPGHGDGQFCGRPSCQRAARKASKKLEAGFGDITGPARKRWQRRTERNFKLKIGDAAERGDYGTFEKLQDLYNQWVDAVHKSGDLAKAKLYQSQAEALN